MTKQDERRNRYAAQANAQADKKETSSSNNEDKNADRGFFKIFRKEKDTGIQRIRLFSAVAGMRETFISDRVFTGNTAKTMRIIEDYMSFRQALTEAQSRYLYFYDRFIQSGHTIDTLYVEVIEDAMDGINTIVKNELNTILFEKTDTKRLSDAVYDVRKELLEFASLYSSMSVDPFTVSFHVPEFFFRSKVAKKVSIPYGTSKNHKQLFEGQFWNEVINHLSHDIYKTTFQYFTPAQKEWGFQEDENPKITPFHCVLVKITSNNSIDADQYDLHPLINSLVSYGWLRSDSSRHLHGVFVVNEPPNDDNSGMAEIRLMTNHPF